MTSTRPGTRGQSTHGATAPPPADGAAHVAGDVEKAVRRDLDGLAERDSELAASGLAASAIALARGIDHPRNSLTSKAMAQRALRETMDRLLELAPVPDAPDRLDALQKRAQGKLTTGGATT